MATLTTTTLTHTTPVSLPATPGTAADTTNGDTYPNGGNAMLLMNNTAGASGTVTVVTPGTVDGLAVADRTYTVPANTIQLVKLPPPASYGTTTRIDCSASTLRTHVYAL
jgi:hypothetical protein